MAVALGVNGGILGPANTPSLSSASGLWTWAEQYRAQRGGTWPVFAIDPYFDYVTLMLHGNGTNGAQNNTFLDSSTNNFTITRNGNTTQGTFTPYGSNWGNYFDGSGDYLTAADNAAFQLGAGAFTIEAFFYSTSSGDQVIISKWGSPDSNAAWEIIYYAGTLYCQVASGSTVTTLTTTTFPLNQWNHVVMVRSGNTLSAYLNGTRFATNGAYSSTVNAGTNGISIGTRAGGSSFPMVGYISNARVVKGTAVYDPTQTTLTVPTAPLTAITNTSLLTCQSNRFIDNSSNNFTITRNGDVSVQRFSPFNPTTPYAAGTIGGSGYFDGSGDYLTVGAASNWAFMHNGSDWTCEFWVNYTGTAAYTILSTTAFSTQIGFTIAVNSVYASGLVNGVQLYTVRGDGTSEAVFNSTALLVPGQWNYVAITFTSSTKTCAFTINGASAGSTSNTGFSYSSSNPTNTLAIGRYQGSTPGNYLLGYLGSLRISNNVRTGLTTIPTAPYTSDANTVLLTNYTNGGIIDNAMMNDLETVGNAQISTSVSKFGGGSMAFDGSGDILSAPGSQNYVFNGDFTVEGWVYIDSTMVSSRPDNLKSFIFVGWNTGNTPQLYVYGTTSTAGIGLGYYDGTTAWDVAATVPKDQWVHIAFARTGSALYGFVNGTRYTINASISATIGSANTFVVGGNPNQVSAYYSYLKGYMDDLRITKGYARYTANFSVPTAPFPDQ